MNDSMALLFGCGGALVAAAAAAAAAWLVRGSTAVPAALWAVVAAGALALEMVLRATGGLADPAAGAAARLVSLALAVCPVMSLLGAKRPQHGVWQFIVASLGVVLALPAISATLVRPGTPPDVHMLERGFLLILLAVGWMNFIGTRHAAAAAIVTTGIGVLARAWLPFVPADIAEAPAPQLDAIACGALAVGAVIAAMQSAWAAWQPSHTGSPSSIAGLVDRPYAAFRETLGAAWTLRIAERFNTVAAERGWPCRLHFRGLEIGGDPDDVDWHRDAVRALRALFHRFVTADWLARHGWAAQPATVAPLKEGR